MHPPVKTALLSQRPQIGFFESPFGNSSVEIPLTKALDAIREGKYAEMVDRARFFYARDRAAYFTLKTGLPAVTFSGIFGDARRLALLKTYTNLIALDIDNLDGNSLPRKKEALFGDRFTHAVWISPSGCGLKILVGLAGAKEYHRSSFEALADHFERKHGLKIDPSGSDITRLCFVSFDSNLFVKDRIFYPDLRLLQGRRRIGAGRNCPNQRQKYPAGGDNNTSSKELFYSKKNRNKSSDRQMISRIIGFLSTHQLSITGDYDSWYRVALAIANTFTYDLGKEYFLKICRLDGNDHDEERSAALLAYCYQNRRIGEISLSSVIYFASKKGFIPRPAHEEGH